MSLDSTDTVRLILREMHAHGSIPRTQIAKLTNLNESSISRNTRLLINSGILVEGPKRKSEGRVGRRHTELNFGSGAVIACIGIRAYAQWVQLCDLGGNVLAEERFSMTDVSDQSAVLKRCSEALERLIANSGLTRDLVIGLSMALIGVVDVKHGVLLRAHTLGWKDVPIARLMRERHGLPTIVDSFINAHNLAINGLPRSDAGKTSALLVLAGVGLGSSLMVDGTLVHGSAFSAGQIGHVPVPGHHALCSCGRRGCLDTYASGRALLARLHDPSFVDLQPASAYPYIVKSFGDLSRRAQTDPELAKELRAAGRQLGETLAVIASATDPDRILLSGFVCGDPHYSGAVKQRLSDLHTPPNGASDFIVELDDGGWDAPAALALDHFVFGDTVFEDDRLLNCLKQH